MLLLTWDFKITLTSKKPKRHDEDGQALRRAEEKAHTADGAKELGGLWEGGMSYVLLLLGFLSCFLTPTI